MRMWENQVLRAGALWYDAASTPCPIQRSTLSCERRASPRSAPQRPQRPQRPQCLQRSCADRRGTACGCPQRHTAPHNAPPRSAAPAAPAVPRSAATPGIARHCTANRHGDHGPRCRAMGDNVGTHKRCPDDHCFTMHNNALHRPAAPALAHCPHCYALPASPQSLWCDGRNECRAMRPSPRIAPAPPPAHHIIV